MSFNFDNNSFNFDADLISRFEKMVRNNDIEYLEEDEFLEIIAHYLNEAKPAKIKKAIKIALRFYPNSPDILILMVEYYLVVEKYQAAQKLLQQLEKSDNREPLLYMTYGRYYLKQDKIQQAYRKFDKAIELYKQDELPEVYISIAESCLETNNFDIAIHYLKHCYNTLPYNKEVYAMLVECYFETENYQELLNISNKQLETNVFDTTAWLQKTSAHYELEQYEQAMEACEYTLAIVPKLYAAFKLKADILIDTKQYEKAIEWVQKEIQKDETEESPNYETYVILANCYEDKQEVETAIFYYEKAFGINPKDDFLSHYIGKLYIEQQQYSKSLFYLQKAVDLNPKDEIYHRYLGFAQLESKHITKGLLSLSRSVACNTSEKTSWLTLISAIFFYNRLDLAVNITSDALKMFPHEMLFYYFNIIFKTKQHHSGNSTEPFETLHLFTDSEEHKRFLNFYNKINSLDNFMSLINFITAYREIKD